MNLVEHLNKSIANAEKEISNINSEILSLRGMSSPKIRHFLNNVVSFPECRYLEIGCWKGSTTISALYKNNPDKYWVIDNFSEVFIDSENTRDEFHLNFNRILGKTPNLIDADFSNINLESHGISNVNVYLYDGKHTDEAQYQALSKYYTAMENEFIFLVDDWNWSTVERATKNAISGLGLKVAFEKVMPAKQEGQDLENWWNGFYVSVLKK
jgi:hypothetical protein